MTLDDEIDIEICHYSYANFSFAHSSYAHLYYAHSSYASCLLLFMHMHGCIVHHFNVVLVAFKTQINVDDICY